MMEQELLTNTIESLMIDKHVKQILRGTFFRAKSVKELCEKYDIPINICSEKVQGLERLGMLTCDRTMVKVGNSKDKYYRSDLLNNHVIYDPNDIYIRFEVMPGISKNYPRWIKVRLY
jgi:hypothetical protein